MKDTGTLGLAVLLIMSQTVCAQTGGAIDRLKTCSQFEGMERLKCVDELLGEMTETHATTPSPSPKWIISETTSPVDYQPQIEALLTARTASQNAASTLAIHCRALLPGSCCRNGQLRAMGAAMDGERGGSILRCCARCQ